MSCHVMSAGAQQETAIIKITDPCVVGVIDPAHALVLFKAIYIIFSTLWQHG